MGRDWQDLADDPARRRWQGRAIRILTIAGSVGGAAIATDWTTGVVTIRQRASKELERGRRGGAASARLSAPTATGGTQW